MSIDSQYRLLVAADSSPCVNEKHYGSTGNTFSRLLTASATGRVVLYPNPTVYPSLFYCSLDVDDLGNVTKVATEKGNTQEEYFVCHTLTDSEHYASSGSTNKGSIKWGSQHVYELVVDSGTTPSSTANILFLARDRSTQHNTLRYLTANSLLKVFSDHIWKYNTTYVGLHILGYSTVTASDPKNSYVEISWQTKTLNVTNSRVMSVASGPQQKTRYYAQTITYESDNSDGVTDEDYCLYTSFDVSSSDISLRPPTGDVKMLSIQHGRIQEASLSESCRISIQTTQERTI